MSQAKASFSCASGAATRTLRRPQPMTLCGLRMLRRFCRHAVLRLLSACRFSFCSTMQSSPAQPCLFTPPCQCRQRAHTANASLAACHLADAAQQAIPDKTGRRDRSRIVHHVPTQGDALRRVVEQSSGAVDRYLLHAVRERAGLLRHCAALRRYLLATSGDFAAALLDAVGPELAGKVCFWFHEMKVMK